MIEYNPKTWFAFIFQFHRADTFRRLLPMMLCIAVYCGAVEYLEIGYLNLTDTSKVKHVSLVHTLLGFALSMLLVFRTNTAYERWWEARKLWGSLVNSSRSLALKLNALILDPGLRTDLATLLSAYPAALKDHLRGVSHPVPAPLHFPHPFVPGEHLPNQIASLIYLRLTQGGLTAERLLLLDPELRNFSEVCGACERIRNTPIPFSYSVFLKKFIFLFVMTLPISYAILLDWLVIPVVVIVFYALASLELIAEEIENPFGTDPNDLPLESICSTIESSIRQLLPKLARNPSDI